MLNMVRNENLVAILDLYHFVAAYAQRTEVYNQHIHMVQVIANNDYMSPAAHPLGRE